jgi:hypothetical protein
MGLIQGVVGWVIGFVSPYMINPDEGNLGAKVGFVFFGLGVPCCLAIWFFVPETRGLSFDDVSFLLAYLPACVKMELIFVRWIICSTKKSMQDISRGRLLRSGAKIHKKGVLMG